MKGHIIKELEKVKMKEFHELTDLFAVGVGILGALLKGMKSKLKLHTTIIGMLVGGILAYSTIGVIDQFFSHLNERIVILISFAVGWVANELTDILDAFVKDAYEITIQKAQNVLKVKKEDKEEDKSE
jgi:hypothetical protein